MINGLMEWSRNIVCFSIFATLVKNLLPGEKYTPYIRLYMGFMMLLVFLTPILKTFQIDATLQYLTEILEGTLQIEEDSFFASINENSNLERQKEEYTKMLEESVTAYLTDQLEQQDKWQGYLVERAEIRWEDREQSEEFGTLKGIAVYLRRKEANAEKEESVQIEPVWIEVFSDSEKEGSEKEEESGQLKHLLATLYHLKEENIAVRIAE